MNKKIVILHPAFWKQAMGGAEIQIKYLVDYLLDNNVQVHYVFEDKNIKMEDVDNHNLFLYPLSRIKISKRFGNRWFLYQNKINRILKAVKPNGIYTRFYSSWSGFAATYANENSIPHVWAIASDNDLKVLEQPFKFMKPLDILENRYVKSAFKNASHILVQNKWQEHELLQKYNRTGVYLSQAAPLEKKSDPRKDKNFINIVWIANMKPLKRPELFIELAKHYRGKIGIYFKMVGRLSPKYSTLIKEEENHNPFFKYLGELTNTEVNALLLNTDILINTSDYEGFSNTFIQAWLRKNIVISMNSNPDKILSNYKVGYLCPTINQVIDKVDYLRENPDDLYKMQEDSIRYARENHSLDRNLEVITNLLKIKGDGASLV